MCVVIFCVFAFNGVSQHLQSLALEALEEAQLHANPLLLCFCVIVYHDLTWPECGHPTEACHWRRGRMSYTQIQLHDEQADE